MIVKDQWANASCSTHFCCSELHWLQNVAQSCIGCLQNVAETNFARFATPPLLFSTPPSFHFSQHFSALTFFNGFPALPLFFNASSALPLFPETLQLSLIFCKFNFPQLFSSVQLVTSCCSVLTGHGKRLEISFLLFFSGSILANHDAKWGNTGQK